MNISLSIAFFAGVISFLSPCVLPLIPGYISFLSGVSLKELGKSGQRKDVIRKAGITSIFFVIGFSIVFVALGASASFIGKLLAKYMAFFTKFAGIIIIVLGLHLLGLLKISALNYQKGFKIKNFTPSYLGALVVGLAFGFGWTPCIGAILAGILALAATQETMLKGMLLLAVYSLGIGIPFIITGFAVGTFLGFFERYKRFIRFGEIIAGLLLISIGILIFSNNIDFLLKLMPPVFFKFAK